ncbi:MAG: methylated-DNA--[protein]-cysteine S-methyltransferase [Betaproteobacteria bacterium]|nr:methylated-DNA--[protein]-cysteine S-methyltransferase [Betaproteobacteria bacterium]
MPASLIAAKARFSGVQLAPFGALGVRIEGDTIVELAFLPAGVPGLAPAGALAREACRQIAAYLDDPRHAFDLPLKPVGTAFQRRVRDAIAAIPRGWTRTYGELARELRSAPRAVGQACGANAFPLVIPCHRVVAATGLGGFAHHSDGFFPGVKRWLLAHEAGSGD